MPTVKVKGVVNPIQFPDSMSLSDIRAVLSDKFSSLASQGAANLEVAGAIASGAVAEPLAGLSGLAGLAVGAGAEASSNVVGKVREGLTYQPRTEKGKSSLEAVSGVLAPIGEYMGRVSQIPGDYVYEKTGSPALATLAYSAPIAAAELLGAKGLSKAGAGKIGNRYEVGDIGSQASKFGGKQRGAIASIETPGANLEQMRAAEELARRGVGRREIFDKTGWTQSQSGDWEWVVSDDILFHGTDTPIRKIDPTKFGSATGAESAKQGFWLSDRPTTAESYANYAARDAKVKRMLDEADAAADKGDWDKYDTLQIKAEALERESAAGKGQNIMPMLLTSDNVKRVDMGGADFMDVQDEVNSMIRESKAQGYDALQFDRLVDDAGLIGGESQHTVVFDTDKLVSKFDPTLRQGGKRELLDVPESELIVRRDGGAGQ